MRQTTKKPLLLHARPTDEKVVGLQGLVGRPPQGPLELKKRIFAGDEFWCNDKGHEPRKVARHGLAESRNLNGCFDAFVLSAGDRNVAVRNPQIVISLRLQFGRIFDGRGARNIYDQDRQRIDFDEKGRHDHDKGEDITLDASGKINAKTTGDVILKGSKVTQD